jgi:Methylase involved in ubiquinone/menaquinone biosynthesis
VSALEDETVRTLELPVARALLDVGCGTARRMAHALADLAVGVDLSPAMLACADTGQCVAAAEATALPIRSASFDRVWCRLMIGHTAECDAVYAELARVCVPGGHVVVTDFHPAAVAAGHRRTFRDAYGIVQEVEHHVHPIDVQQCIASRHGLEIAEVREAVVGATIERFYREVEALDAYEAQCGLPLVTVLAFRRAS